MAAQYKVLIGINYPGKGGKEKRAEPGEIVSDIPKIDIGWLTDQGVIELLPEGSA